jgi:hypothetical protein
VSFTAAHLINKVVFGTEVFPRTGYLVMTVHYLATNEQDDLIGEPEVKSPIALLLPGHLVHLILLLFFRSHLVPFSLLPPIEYPEVLPL